MIAVRHFDPRLLKNVLIVVKAYTGLHYAQGIQVIIYRSLFDDGGKIFTFFLLS